MSKLEKPAPNAGSLDQGFRATFPSGSELDRLTRVDVHGIHPQPHRATDEELLDLAQRIFETRKARTQFFAPSMLGEPVWDMLLALFTLRGPTKRMTVSRLCEAAGLAGATGNRWMQTLENKRLIVRQRDPHDGRKVYLVLTEEGEALMRQYLSSVANQLGG